MLGKGERTPKEVCKDMADNAYMHGLAGIRRERKTYKKIFWIIIFLGALGGLVWQTYTMVAKYYAFKTTTTTDIVYQHNVAFPAVTVCNVNAVRWKLLKNTSWAKDLVTKMENPVIPSDVTLNATRRWATEIDIIVDRDDYELATNFTRGYRSQNLTERYKLGHQIEEMLIECSFMQMQCAPKLFTISPNPIFGNCFTFDPSKIPRTDSEIVSGTGPNYGLRLSFYTEQENYLKTLTADAGMVITVHEFGQMPYPEDHGVPLAPGFRTLVGIRKNVINRSKYPYGKCQNITTETEKQKLMGYTSPLLHYNYTEEACQKACAQCHLVKKCGCYESFYTNYLSCIQKDTPMCTKLNKTEDACVVRHKKDVGKLCNMDRCPPGCREVKYRAAVSSSRWPAQHKQIDIVEDVCKFQPHLCHELKAMTTTQRNDYMNHNFVKVDVYFEQLQFTEISSLAAYRIEDLLSDLGGTMGLWMGLSVIALIEVIEFIVDFLLSIGRNMRSSTRVVNTQPVRSKSNLVDMDKY